MFFFKRRKKEKTLENKFDELNEDQKEAVRKVVPKAF